MEVSLRRFRTLLTEIDVVLRGLISQKEQLPRLKDGRAAEIAEQLGVLHEHLGLDQESIWPIEVTDTWTRVLIEKVTDELPTVDEIALATQYIDTIRGLLSVLSHIREETAPRDGNVPRPVFANAGPDAKNLNRKLLAYEAVNGRIRLRSAPLRHVVHTTTRCNLRCLTCFQSASQDFLHYDIADASRAALKPSVLLAQQVMVAGTGEPLLSRSARLLIAEYKQAGAYVEVITNGTKLALQSDLLDDVDVLLLSFDGGTERSYNAIRRGGNFQTLVAKIGNLPSHYREKICLNFVVSKQNVYTAKECIELAMRLKLGQVHFQEMTAYLPWHDRMLIGEADRAWLLSHFSSWAAAAKSEGVAALCHLVPTRNILSQAVKDTEALTSESLSAVADVPVAKMPARLTFPDISSKIQALLLADVPVVLKRLSAAVQKISRTKKCSPVFGQVGTAQLVVSERAALSRLMQRRMAKLPHCLSTYAHILINEDGTTRSCCKVQSRLASLSVESFHEIRNSPSNLELRRAHARQIAPRRECVGCRDPLRFHFLVELLGELKADGVDISRIRKPPDFPVPASSAEHPLVKELGSHAGMEPSDSCDETVEVDFA